MYGTVILRPLRLLKKKKNRKYYVETSAKNLKEPEGQYTFYRYGGMLDW
jgi:hypothetical protein